MSWDTVVRYLNESELNSNMMVMVTQCDDEYDFGLLVWVLGLPFLGTGGTWSFQEKWTIIGASKQTFHIAVKQLASILNLKGGQFLFGCLCSFQFTSAQ